MARRGGAAVQTVFIEGSSRYLGKGWGLFRKPELPLVYRARLGRRFDVPADLQGFTDAVGSLLPRHADCRPGAQVTPAPSTTHLVLIPSYNTGPLVLDTVRARPAAMGAGLGGGGWQHRWQPGPAYGRHGRAGIPA